MSDRNPFRTHINLCPVVQLAELTPGKPGMAYAIEASDLALCPGQWPAALVVRHGPTPVDRVPPPRNQPHRRW